MGKHKPIWDPSTDCGDYVVATGCNEVLVTGRKMKQKLYYKQTTRPGALRSMNMESMIKKWGGGEILKRAVSGMLPKNRLREPRLSRLKGEFRNYTEGSGSFLSRAILDWNETMDTADLLGLVFEGPAHPYQKNLMKVASPTTPVEVS